METAARKGIRLGHRHQLRARPGSATPARSANSSTARWATPSTWPVACKAATKYLKSPLLITSATHELLQGIFPARRVCTVRVVNIAEPVDLYELGAADDERWMMVCQGYEKALNLFEAGQFLSSAQELSKVLAANPDDGPSLILLSRACNWAVNPEKDEQFQREWVLPGK